MATLNFTPKGNMRLATDADTGRAIFRIVKTPGGWVVQDYITSWMRIRCADVSAARRAAQGIYNLDRQYPKFPFIWDEDQIESAAADPDAAPAIVAKAAETLPAGWR